MQGSFQLEYYMTLDGASKFDLELQSLQESCMGSTGNMAMHPLNSSASSVLR